jgi:hypothetical protein
MDPLLLEIAGLLTLLAQGVNVPNLQEQAAELLEKVGQRLDDDEDAEMP